MAWDEELVEPEEEDRYAGPLGRFAGRTAHLSLADDSYELRYEDDLLGRLTRPERFMVAETLGARWELRHPRPSVNRIDAVELVSGAIAARYRRKLISGRASITTMSPHPYRLRRKGREWQLTQPPGDELLSVGPGRHSGEHALAVVREPDVSSDFGVLALLCCYVVLLGETPVPGAGSGG
jgi:hypothetical protein